ncbi:MAG: hypothetical protein ACTS5A_00510 [Candidatus Hodgkinia cicadicola]
MGEVARTILLKNMETIQNNLKHSVNLIVKLFWNLLYSSGSCLTVTGGSELKWHSSHL